MSIQACIATERGRRLLGFRENSYRNPLPGSHPIRPGPQMGDEWKATLRCDPCSYCGGRGGTVDHISPKAYRPQGIRGCWSDYTGACLDCNMAKGIKPLIWFLYGHRRGA
jgi:hypothetical protein